MPTLAVVLVAARLGDRADDAAERRAVLGGVAARLGLHVVSTKSTGSGLPDVPLQEIGRVDAVDHEAIVGAAGAVDLDAAIARLTR